MTFDDPKKTWRFLAKVTHYIYCSTALVYLYLRQVVVKRSQPEEIIESHQIEYNIGIRYIIIHLAIGRQIRYVIKFGKHGTILGVFYSLHSIVLISLYWRFKVLEGQETH